MQLLKTYSTVFSTLETNNIYIGISTTMVFKVIIRLSCLHDKYFCKKSGHNPLKIFLIILENFRLYFWTPKHLVLLRIIVIPKLVFIFIRQKVSETVGDQPAKARTQALIGIVATVIQNLCFLIPTLKQVIPSKIKIKHFKWLSMFLVLLLTIN